MVYGRNLRPGSVINHGNGWGVVDRVEPFGSGDAHAYVWMVGQDSAITVRLATSMRLSAALRSVAVQARKLWAEVRRLRSELNAAEQQRDAIAIEQAPLITARNAAEHQLRQALAALRRNELDAPATDAERAAVARLGSLAAGQLTDAQIQAAAARHHIGGNDHG